MRRPRGGPRCLPVAAAALLVAATTAGLLLRLPDAAQAPPPAAAAAPPARLALGVLSAGANVQSRLAPACASWLCLAAARGAAAHVYLGFSRSDAAAGLVGPETPPVARADDRIAPFLARGGVACWRLRVMDVYPPVDKTLRAWADLAQREGDAAWTLVVDDDTEVDLARIWDVVAGLAPPDTPTYAGQAMRYPHPGHPDSDPMIADPIVFAGGGAGVLLSRAAVQALAARIANGTCAGGYRHSDVGIGHCLAQAGIAVTHIPAMLSEPAETYCAQLRAGSLPANLVHPPTVEALARPATTHHREEIGGVLGTECGGVVG